MTLECKYLFGKEFSNPNYKGRVKISPHISLNANSDLMDRQ